MRNLPSKQTGDAPRIYELREIGLPRWLLDLAEDIGVDAVLAVWRRLSDAAREHGDNRVHIPAWLTYLRYQRNRFIYSLDEAGKTPCQIRKEVATALCEQLSLSHIKLIIRRR